MTTDILILLERCIGLEHAAATIYEILARRFAADAELAALFATLARDEHDHARSLASWHEAIAREPVTQRPQASGFDEGIADVHWLLAESRTAAESADEEEAFAIVLAIENSELDVIHATLLESSPFARYPEVAAGLRHDTASHHAKLLAVATRRCRTEKTMLRAALLAGHHPAH
jgi:rubrerythrin